MTLDDLLYQDTVEYLKIEASGGMKRDTEQQTIQDAMYLIQRGIIAVPVKVTMIVEVGHIALAGGLTVTINRFLLLVARTEEIIQTMLIGLNAGLKKPPNDLNAASITVLSHG